MQASAATSLDRSAQSDRVIMSNDFPGTRFVDLMSLITTSSGAGLFAGTMLLLSGVTQAGFIHSRFSPQEDTLWETTMPQ